MNKGEFWDNKTSLTFSHITLDKWLVNETYYNKLLSERVFYDTKVKEKNILDFGIGGGWSGKYILDNGAKKYVGVDISSRSIEAARNNLKKHKSVELIKINSCEDVETKEIDVLVSLAVIQHFDSQASLNKFLDWVNKSGIKTLLLQIKHAEKTTINTRAYESVHALANACKTNPVYLAGKLTNYKLKRVDTYKDKKNTLQYLKYEIK